MSYWEVIDFGPGPKDETADYPFQGTEQECIEWMAANQETTIVDGQERYRFVIQETSPVGWEEY